MPLPRSFLRFSPHVQDLIVDYLDVPDILEFARLSKKTTTIVKSVTRFKRYTIWFTWDDSNVNVKVEEPNDRPHAIFKSERIEEYMSTHTHWSRILDHMKDLFNEVSIDVFIGGRCKKETLEILKNRKIRTLEWGGTVSPEAVKFLLDELDVDDLEFSCVVEPDTNFRYSNPLTHRKVYIEEAKWLDWNAILNSTSRVMGLGVTFPSTSYFNAILKHWLSGGMENLEELEIISVCAHLPDYPTEVFKDIKFTDWDPNVTTKTLRLADREAEFQEGREIVRFDGTKRAIVVAEVDGPFLQFSINVFTPETLIKETKR